MNIKMDPRIILVTLCIILEVGCDGVIGSGMRFDSCHVCGGEDKTCRVVSGIFTRRNLPYGYTKIATVPRGACNVNITELHQSTNYLALRVTDDEYVINGNWGLGNTNRYLGAGTSFQYFRPTRADPSALHESIFAEGPTNVSIDIMILKQEENQGVMYSYNIAQSEASSSSSAKKRTRVRPAARPVQMTNTRNNKNDLVEKLQADGVRYAGRYRTNLRQAKRRKPQLKAARGRSESIMGAQPLELGTPETAKPVRKVAIRRKVMRRKPIRRMQGAFPVGLRRRLVKGAKKKRGRRLRKVTPGVGKENQITTPRVTARRTQQKWTVTENRPHVTSQPVDRRASTHRAKVVTPPPVVRRVVGPQQGVAGQPVDRHVVGLQRGVAGQPVDRRVVRPQRGVAGQPESQDVVGPQAGGTVVGQSIGSYIGKAGVVELPLDKYIGLNRADKMRRDREEYQRRLMSANVPMQTFPSTHPPTLALPPTTSRHKLRHSNHRPLGGHHGGKLNNAYQSQLRAYRLRLQQRQQLRELSQGSSPLLPPAGKNVHNQLPQQNQPHYYRGQKPKAPPMVTRGSTRAPKPKYLRAIGPKPLAPPGSAYGNYGAAVRPLYTGFTSHVGEGIYSGVTPARRMLPIRQYQTPSIYVAPRPQQLAFPGGGHDAAQRHLGSFPRNTHGSSPLSGGGGGHATYREYEPPREVVRTLGNNVDFVWKISGFTECDRPCGGGKQDTKILCVKVSSQAIVTDVNCDPEDRPKTQSVVCNNNACSAAWESGNWSECSTTCDPGQQTRTVECQQRVSAQLTLSVSASRCQGERKPVTTQSCNDDKPCIRWNTQDWSKCSTECGRGHMYRRVWCVNADENRVADSRCSGPRPRDTKACNMGSCSNTWFYTDWSDQCSSSCGEGVHSRKLFCASDVTKCITMTKPETTKRCENTKPCGGLWFAGPWSQCSATCGQGLVTRDIVCMKKMSRGLLAVVGSENCFRADRPHAEEPCENAPCEPQWYMADWSRCTKSCGSGVRTRELRCMDEQQEPSDGCPDYKRPPNTESCNPEPCPRRHTAPSRQRPSHDSSVEVWHTASKVENANDGEADNDKKPVSSGCEDKFNNCELVIQARLCRYSYYKSICCHSCIGEN